MITEVRLALGARRSTISWMIFREGVTLAAIGSMVGLAMAIPLPIVFDSMFNGLRFGAHVLYPVVAATTLVVAGVSTLIPAHRAAHVDPSTALRNE